MIGVARGIMASGQRVEVFLRGVEGLDEIDGIPVEVVVDARKRRRRLKRLEEKGLEVWLLP